MDTKEIKLPLSGSTVVIRTYTTQADDEVASQLLYEGVIANGGKDASLQFPLANVVASEASYIPRLVQSIDGNSDDLNIRLGSLRSQDYAVIADAVKHVVEENSPKVTAADRDKAESSIKK